MIESDAESGLGWIESDRKSALRKIRIGMIKNNQRSILYCVGLAIPFFVKEGKR